MENISFVKMNGAGNDFIVINKNDYPDMELSSQLISKLCHRKYGIGADGLIAIQKSKISDFEMKYFNADGSIGSLCGNGARCAVKFASIQKYFTGNITKFLVGDELFIGELIDDYSVKFYLQPKLELKEEFTLVLDGYEMPSYYVHTGSPHVVIKIDDVRLTDNKKGIFHTNIEDFHVFKIGREIRNSNYFAPGGVNVNFIQFTDGKIFIRTYERGVEDETLACGTGSVAAALIANVYFDMKVPIKLVTRGKDILIVNFQLENNEFKNLSLTGPVKINYTGNFNYYNFTQISEK
jgi:diaminopimelate epimerase